MKKIEKDTKRRKDIPYLWIGNINIVKMSKLPKAIYRFNAILIKVSMATYKKNPKIHNHKRPQLDKAILKNK